jgi:hypothetical protein
MKNFLPIVFALGFFFSLTAQVKFGFEFDSQYPVVHGNDTLLNPWAGGMYAAQFATYDVDGDGLDDLVVFDRFGSRILPFIRVQSNGTPKWKYDYKFVKYFPAVEDMMKFVDFNCDGKKDIVSMMTTINGYGLAPWVNVSSGTEPAFQYALPTNGPLMSTYNNNTFKTNLYVASSDIPVFADINNDGAMDVLTFGNFGTTLEWHKGQVPCGLDFVRVAECWGRFAEGFFDNTIFLNHCPPNLRKTDPLQSNKTEHAGATILNLDLTNNGLPDLIIGDIDSRNLTALYNTGSIDSAVMTAKDSLFPSYDVPVNMGLFPGSYYEDVDFDGVKDLVVAPNMVGYQVLNYNNVKFYKNKGTNALPNFELTDTMFLHDGMIDLGESAAPVLYDLNGDGLLDLIVSSDGRYVRDSVLNPIVAYYENVGTASNPIFNLVTENFANLSSFQLGARPIPAFGDLTGNGLPDMIVGSEDGHIHFFTNTGTLSNPAFTLTSAFLGNINVGMYAAPFLYDIDGDGGLDLIIGNWMGTIHHYKNNLSQPLSFTLVTERFGGVNVKSPQFHVGFSNPILFEHGNQLNLLVGTYDMGVVQFDSIAQVLNAPLNVLAESPIGTSVSPSFNETPFGATRRTGRNQILFTASELKSEGMRYGKIHALHFHVSTTGNPTFQNGVRISMKHTSANAITGFETGFTEVYNSRLTLGQGWNRIILHTEFDWNETDNLLIEICYDRNLPGNDIMVFMHDAGFPASAYGDMTNFNTMTARGCEMPFSQATNLRPNMKMELIPAFKQTDTFLKEGRRNFVAIGDLNEDIYPDAILGNTSGGVQFYRGVAWTPSTVSVREVEVAKNMRLRMYPNPSDGHVTLEAPSELRSLAHIQVYTISGALILDRPWETWERFLDLNKLPEGVYLVNMTHEQDVYHDKLIIQRR